MEQTATVLAVDLGTTWTAAAVHRAGQVEAIHLGDRGAAIPSVLAVADDGSLVAGVDAERVMAAAPERGVREVKRRFGDTTPVVLGGDAHLPDALVVALLRAVAAQVGVDPAATEVVLTHPANWGDYKLELLRNVADQVGFVSCRLVSEPVAAARHFAAAGRLQAGQSVAVYDFGGGTFDVAIVRLGDSGPEIVGAPQGIERLGGIDIDQAVFGHVSAALAGTFDGLDRSDPEVRRALLRVRAACTEAKEQLSADSEATITVTAPGLSTQVRVTRVELEQAVRPRVAETVRALERAVAAAGLELGDLAGVVLVGGSSRLPLVAEMVAAATGLPLVHDADPKSVVAMGALVAPAGDHPVTSSAPQPSSDHSSQTTPQEGNVSDQEPTTASTESAPERSSIAPPPEKKKDQGAVSPGVVAGVAAAGAAAVAAGIVYGDEITDAVSDALGLGGEDAEAAIVDESMDAFDEVVEEVLGEPAAGPSAAAAPSAAGFAPPAAPAAASSAPPPPPAPTTPPSSSTPPPPPPAPPAEPADEAPVEEAPVDTAAAAAMEAPDGDGEFDAVRAALLERIGSLELGEDVLEEDLEALREELRGVVDRFRPADGESTEDALVRLRDAYDERVRDFTQDQKIDALIEEQIRDNQREQAELDEAEAAATEVLATEEVATEEAVAEEAVAEEAVTEEAAVDDELPAAEPEAEAPESPTLEAPTIEVPAGVLDDSFDDLITDASELIDRVDVDDLVAPRLEVPEIDVDVLGDLRLPEPEPVVDLPIVPGLLPEVDLTLSPGADLGQVPLERVAEIISDIQLDVDLDDVAAETLLPAGARTAIGDIDDIDDLDLPSLGNLDVEVDAELDLNIEVTGLDDLGL